MKNSRLTQYSPSHRSLSSNCTTTLENILASPDAACLNPSGLVAAVAGANANTSVITPLNSWLTGLCAQPACSNSTLSAVVANVTSGCSAELATAGLNNIDAGTLTTYVQEFYPAVRQAVCLKDTQNNTLCATELLTDLQTSLGTTLSLTAIVNLVPQLIAGTASIPSNIECSDCVKGVYNIVQQQVPTLVQGSVASGVASACGASFTNGANPTEIAELASTSTASASGKTSGAALVSANGLVAVPMTGLVAVSSVFAILV
ncbi:hypothetical protein HWV62_22990 [Athelia sp. TMB]|nr:hypothetical protein HWV62_22990 [Athelia sp. TMB]